jgi:hypothetical protein
MTMIMMVPMATIGHHHHHHHQHHNHVYDHVDINQALKDLKAQLNPNSRAASSSSLMIGGLRELNWLSYLS